MIKSVLSGEYFVLKEWQYTIAMEYGVKIIATCSHHDA
jgi:hypothetical protein